MNALNMHGFALVIVITLKKVPWVASRRRKWVFIGRNFGSIIKPIVSLAEAAENPKIFYLHLP